MRKLLSSMILPVLLVYLPAQGQPNNYAVDPLIVVNGDFDSPGDTWSTGGGVPDGWTIENHPVEKKTAHGTVGLNHRWFGLPNHSPRSLYLIDPQEATIKQELQGAMASGVKYTLRYGYFRYGNAPATITARLIADQMTLASQTFAAEEFPHRTWQMRELTYVASANDENLPITIAFQITGQGDVRLDGVSLLTITPEKERLNRTLAECTRRVAMLPENTDREKQKKAILFLALERAENTGEAGTSTEYETQLNEVEAAIGTPIQTRQPSALSKTLLPELKTVEGNPYLESLYSWAEDALKTPDTCFKKATTEFNPISNFGIARKIGQDVNRYFWLATHPQSQYYGNPELITRLFRRLHAYADAHQLHGHDYRSPSNDFFAIGPTVQAMLKTRTTYPDLLLPNDEACWEAMVKQVHAFWLGEYKKGQDGAYRMGRYGNRDVAVGNILQSCGLYLNDKEALDAARFLMMSQAENLYPDGAFSYIGTQNECFGYHPVLTGPLTTYYHLSGETAVLDIVKKSEWYAPLTVEPGNVSDLWTVPSWKHVWTGYGYGGESVVSLSGNRYERGILDHQIAKQGASPSPLDAMWYRGDIKAAAPPDSYTIFDRNILGPRGRFGRFSYAATLRVPGNTEPGKATIMGAMTIKEGKDEMVNPWEAMLMGIMPRVFVETTPEEVHKHPDWAYLTCHDKSGTSMGRDWCALQSRYQLHTFGSSQKGPEVLWEGSQIWFGIRDRLFGLLEIAPKEEQKAYEVGMLGRIRYNIDNYKSVSPNQWAAGSLNVTVLSHNFDSLRTVETTTAKSPELQIICSTQPLEGLISDRTKTNRENTTLKTFTPEKPYYAVVEVSHSQVVPEAGVKRIVQGNLSGLSVELAGANYAILVNRGDTPYAVDLDKLGLPTSGGWLHYPRVSMKEPTPLKRRKLLIPSGEHRVILSGMPVERASQAGWRNFEEMLNERESLESD